MADDGTAAATSSRLLIFPRGGERTAGLLAALLIVVAFAGLAYLVAGKTILGRYARYRAEDAAVAVRRELRQTADAFDDWWRHVERTVATRDKRRGADRTADVDAPRWVGVVDVPPP